MMVVLTGEEAGDGVLTFMINVPSNILSYDVSLSRTRRSGFSMMTPCNPAITLLQYNV